MNEGNPTPERAEHALTYCACTCGWADGWAGLLRVEGFLDARSLEPAQMYHPRVAPRIAHALATFHSNDPGSGSSSCGGGGSEPNLWDKIETFISLVQEKMRAPDCADMAAIVGASVDVDHYIREYFRSIYRLVTASMPLSDNK